MKKVTFIFFVLIIAFFTTKAFAKPITFKFKPGKKSYKIVWVKCNYFENIRGGKIPMRFDVTKNIWTVTVEIEPKDGKSTYEYVFIATEDGSTMKEISDKDNKNITADGKKSILVVE